MITPLRPVGEGEDQENVIFCSLGMTAKLCGVLETAEINYRWGQSSIIYTFVHLFFCLFCFSFDKILCSRTLATNAQKLERSG